MKTTLKRTELLALILLATATITGCESFKSPSADYVKPGDLCTDVSLLPDPNESPKDQSAGLRNVTNQMGYGAKREESPERLLMQADSYFEQKRFHDSARLYKKYLNTSAAASAAPDLIATIHYRIGFVASKKMFYTEAKNEFAQALRIAPMNNEFLFGYAKACYDSGDFQTADQQFATLLQRAPSYPEAQHYYGLTLLEGSNRANALQPLANSLGALQAHALLADKYYEVGELELAAQLEAQMIQLAAQSVQPIPKLPHKEQILANAQNAAYAQALAGNATNGTAATQYAQVVPGLPGITATVPAAVTPPNAPSAPSNPLDAVEQNQTTVATATVNPTTPTTLSKTTETQVASTPNSVAASVEPTARMNFSETPNAVISATPQPVQIATQPTNDQSAPVATYVAQLPVQYEQVSPIIPNQQSTEVKPQPVQTSQTQGPQFSYPEQQVGNSETSDFDEENWDDSAFATSGATVEEPKTLEHHVAPTPESYGYQPQQEVLQNAPVQQYPDGFYTSPTPTLPISNSSPQPLNGERRLQDTSSGHYPQNKAVQGFEEYQNPSFTQNEEKISVGYIVASQLSVSDLHYYAKRLKEVIGTEGVSIEPLKNEQDSVNARDKRLAKNDSKSNETTSRQIMIPVSSENDFATKNSVRLSSSEEPKQEKSESSRPLKTGIKPTIHLGAGNPGLFVESAASHTLKTRLAFRPGSIDDSDEIEQNKPDEIAVRLARRSSTEEVLPIENNGVVLNPYSEADWQLALNRAELIFTSFKYLDETALVYYDPFIVQEEDEDDWDEAAFVTSGNIPQVLATTQNVASGGFGDYNPPMTETFTEPLQDPIYVAQVSKQHYPAPNLENQPLVSNQQAIVPQRLPSPTNNASLRTQTTPTDRLEAARRAGAQVIEISPEQYRQAVRKGLGSTPR